MEPVKLRVRRAQRDQPHLTILRKHGVTNGGDLGAVNIDGEPTFIEVEKVDSLDTDRMPGLRGELDRDLSQHGRHTRL